MAPTTTSLDQDHGNDAPVAHAHCLERAELLQVLHREQIKRLPGDGGADQEREQYGGAEVDGDARVLQIIHHRQVGEAHVGQRLQIGLLRDAPGQLLGVDTGLGLGQHEGRQPSGRGGRHEQGGLAEARVDDWHSHERLRCPIHSHDHGPALVHLDDSARVQRFARPHLVKAGLIDQDGVGDLQVADLANEHVRRCTREAGVIQAHQNDALVSAVGQLGLALPSVQVDGPGHAGNAADAEEVVVGDGFQVIDVADAGVHHPDVGPVRVADLAGGAQHDAAKDGALLGDEKAGEADAEDDGEVFAFVSHQHLQGNPDHRIFLSPEETAPGIFYATR